MTRGSLAILLLVTACGGKIEPDAGVRPKQSSGGTGGSKSTGASDSTGGSKSSGGSKSIVQVDYTSLCKGDTTTLPSRLECTGLYANVKDKTLADGVHEYKPALLLWSDGAVKTRYIFIPKGQKIDASNPNEWTFPVGTKVWKQFVVGGKRMETRLFEKLAEGVAGWSHATYAWNDDESTAVAFDGGDVASPDGGVYHIPIYGECEQCHRGRRDYILGFEQVGLGLDGATGVTLADLVKEDLLDPPPAVTSLSIGDDGTGLAAPALGWLHMNCGVTCHNENAGATAYSAGMKLRLDPAELDGRAVNDFDAVKTTLGMAARNPNFGGQTRIMPGNTTQSLLVKLITTRVTAGDPNTSQMPPIATRVVDIPDSDAVKAWISAMPRSATADGGGGG